MHVLRLANRSALLCRCVGSAYALLLVNPNASPRGDVAQLRALLSGKDHGCDDRDSNGGTPLHHACYNKHAEAVRLLLELGARVDPEDQDKGTPLHNAAFVNAEDCLKLLIQSKANVEHKDVDGSTPLHKASYSGNVRCVKLLLDHKAEINAADNEGVTALQKAIFNNKVECVELLLARKADPNLGDCRASTALHKACFNGNMECVQKLLAAGADVNARDSDKTTPLHNAVYHGHVDVVQLLVQTRGIDLNCETARFSSTPAHFAAFHGFVEVLQLLLKAGAAVDPRDVKKMTPLHYAVRRNQEDCAEFLVATGADVAVRDAKHRGWADMTESASMAAIIRGRKSAMLSDKELVAVRTTAPGKQRMAAYEGTIRGRKARPQVKDQNDKTAVADVDAAEEEQVHARLDRNGFLIEGNGDDNTRNSAGDDTDVALKWTKIFGKWDASCSQIQDTRHKTSTSKMKKMQTRCERGIPPRVRGRAWCLLLGATSELNPARRKLSYSTVVKETADAATVKQIRRDVTRTFPKNARLMTADGQETLFRVLQACAVRSPLVGYCQGMGFVVGMLLMYLEEEDAFWCMDQVLSHPNFNMGTIWSPGLSGLPRCFAVLDGLFELTMPKLHRHMLDQGVGVDMYATQWFLTTYLYNLPFAVVLRIWDVFITEGFTYLYCVALGLLKISSDQLMKMEFEELFNLLQFSGKDSSVSVDANALVAAATNFKEKVRKHAPKFEAKFDSSP